MKHDKCPTCGAPATFEWQGLELVAESGDETLASKVYKYAPASTPPVSAMEDGWVKVENGLPEVGKLDEGTPVLAFPYCDCYYGEFENAEYGGTKSIGFYKFDSFWDGDREIKQRTHWMPRPKLPSPPTI